MLDDLPILVLQLSAQTIQLSEQDVCRGLHLFHLDLPEIRSFVHLPSFVPLVRDVPHQLDSFHVLRGRQTSLRDEYIHTCQNRDFIYLFQLDQLGRIRLTDFEHQKLRLQLGLFCLQIREVSFEGGQPTEGV